MPREKKTEPGPGTPAWLTTYGDMVTLVLCFFVLLYAFSTIDSRKYVQIAQSMRGALGGTNSILTGDPAVISPQVSSIMQVYNEIKQVIDKSELKGKAEISLTERGITISFKEKLFFRRGSASLTNEALPVLQAVGEILKKQRYPLRIEGHTCDLPINSRQFPSNWELSAIRAVNVSKFLIDKVEISPEHISIAGYGQYRPLVPNISEENRAKNRRVDIVVITGSAKSNAVKVIGKKPGEPKESAETGTEPDRINQEQ